MTDSNVVGPSAAGTTDAPQLQDIPFSVTSADGTNYAVDLKLSKLMSFSAANNAYGLIAPSGSSAPCTSDDVDPTRDAVAVGTLSIQNQTPSFTEDMNIDFAEYGTNWILGVGYGNGADCARVSDYGQGKINPTFTGATWGPVGVEIIYSGFFSPAHPQGDPSAASPSGEPLLLGASGEITPNSTLLQAYGGTDTMGKPVNYTLNVAGIPGS